jgi:N-acetylmuramoyl-L-alanine amidase
MTRTNDTFIPLEERTRIANQYSNALFISIHFNSGGAGTGLETYTLAPRGVPSMMADGPRVTDLQQCAGNINDAQNIALATATHASLVVRSRMYDRGIKRARFVVIRDIIIPGVLIEGGFLSNDYDARLIATPAYRQQMASSIMQAVQNYRRAVGTQAGETVAHNTTTEGPRVETNTPMLRGGTPTINEAQPTVITNTGAN